MEAMVVNEIYLSLQGESTWAGWPCVFVRLTGCDLRCSYCDTAYAFREGRKWTQQAVLDEVGRLAGPYREGSGVDGVRLPLVELTGGEPLLQRAVLPFMTRLCDAGYTVLLETSGAHDIAPVDPRVHRIMDIKCPSSGESSCNRWENIPHLRPTDEIKFVLGSVEDYNWMREQLYRQDLAARCPILVSWVQPLAPSQASDVLKKVPPGQTPISRRELAERILADALPVRFQVQMHKVIWSPEERGV